MATPRMVSNTIEIREAAQPTEHDQIPRPKPIGIRPAALCKLRDRGRV
jgi:hypothetical protein